MSRNFMEQGPYSKFTEDSGESIFVRLSPCDVDNYDAYEARRCKSLPGRMRPYNLGKPMNDLSSF